MCARWEKLNKSWTSAIGHDQTIQFALNNNVILLLMVLMVIHDAQVFGFADSATGSQTFLLQKVNIIVVRRTGTQSAVARTVKSVHRQGMNNPGPIKIPTKVDLKRFHAATLRIFRA